MSAYPETPAFVSVSVLLPLINETISLRKTVDVIREGSSEDVRVIIIVMCEKTTPQSMEAVNQIKVEHASLVRVHSQTLPFLGGAIKEALELVETSHVLVMASDLETDPKNIPIMIAHPNAIVTASCWRGGRYHDYDRVKLTANWLFQKFFSIPLRRQSLRHDVRIPNLSDASCEGCAVERAAISIPVRDAGQGTSAVR